MVTDPFAFLKNDVNYVIFIVQNLSQLSHTCRIKSQALTLALSFSPNQILG